VASVLATGAGAALFFRKDASPATSWQSVLDESPFRERVERRVADDAQWAKSAAGSRVEAVSPDTPGFKLPTAEAAAVRPQAIDATPAFRKTFNPVGAMLEPIQALPEDDDARPPASQGTFRSSFAIDPLARTTDIEHRIADGDTLSKLAQQYLGRGDRYLEIYDRNRDVLSNPDLLPIGVVLKIPRTAATPPWNASSDEGSWMPATDLAPVERRSASIN
ncbi:MAG: LysM peptidoglycan-binding domain-containing protein, partial [Pirellulales bacterium]